MGKNTVHASRFKTDRHGGNAKQLISVYEAKGYVAQRDGDDILSQLYFQQAEHWKRVHNGQAE